MNVRILREAGGLGDVLCTFPVARAVKGKWPDATLYYFCLEDYGDVIAHCDDVDEFVPVSMQRRRPRDTEPDPERYPYLAGPDLPEFDVTIDCWCPAFRYEREHSEKIARNRVESFCAAGDLTPSDYCPRFTITAEEKAWALGWCEAQGFDRRSMIGLQPVSLGARRDWPFERWVKLAEALLAHGAAVLVYHSFFSKVKDVPGRKVTGLPIGKATAVLAECDAVVAPDSGFFHLSAAVGVPAVGLFGSTSADQIAKFYPLARTIWPKDEPRKKSCKVPCHSFQWCGCDDECHRNGCEVLAKITVEQVLDMLASIRKRQTPDRQAQRQPSPHRRHRLIQVGG